MGGGGIYVQLPYTVINVWLPYTVINVWRINVWVEGAFTCSYRVGVTHVWDDPPK